MNIKTYTIQIEGKTFTHETAADVTYAVVEGDSDMRVVQWCQTHEAAMRVGMRLRSQGSRLPIMIEPATVR